MVNFVCVCVPANDRNILSLDGVDVWNFGMTLPGNKPWCFMAQGSGSVFGLWRRSSPQECSASTDQSPNPVVFMSLSKSLPCCVPPCVQGVMDPQQRCQDLGFSFPEPLAWQSWTSRHLLCVLAKLSLSPGLCHDEVLTAPHVPLSTMDLVQTLLQMCWLRTTTNICSSALECK